MGKDRKVTYEKGTGDLLLNPHLGSRKISESFILLSGLVSCNAGNRITKTQIKYTHTQNQHRSNDTTNNVDYDSELQCGMAFSVIRCIEDNIVILCALIIYKTLYLRATLTLNLYTLM